MNRSNNVVRITGLIAAALCLVPVAGGAEEFAEILAQAPLRAAVIDMEAGVAYFAAYDQAEVWRTGLASRETLATVAVGKGPVALALSNDRSVLACVNRLGKTATLIRTSDLKVIAEAPCGEGACDVAALPGGGFAVANGFSDSVTVVDPARPDSPVTLGGATSVPNGVAASGSLLAATTRLPAGVVFFRGGADKPTARLSLAATPTAIASLENGRFAVATEGGVAVIDADKILKETSIEGGAVDIAVCDGMVYALSGDDVIVLDSELRVEARNALAAAASALSVGSGVVVAVSPKTRSWQIRGGGGASPPAALEPASAPEMIEPEDSTEEPASPEAPPAVQEAETLSPEPAPAPEESKDESPEAPPTTEEAAPASPEPTARAEPVTPEPEPVAKEEPASPEPEAAVQKPVSDEEGKTATAAVETPPHDESTPQAESPSQTPDIKPTSESFKRKRPVLKTEAPHFTRSKPDAAPTSIDMSGGLAYAFTQSTTLGGQEGGFQVPDWTEPLDTVRSDEMSGSWMKDSAAPMLFQGNVHWQLGPTTASMDELEVKRATNELWARGNVEIRQDLASLNADELYYDAPVETDEEIAPLLAADKLDEQQRAKRVLSLGRIEAKNFHFVEPNRELTADYLEYDFVSKTGALENAKGHAGIFYFGAKKMRVLGPASVDGEEVWVTTCDHDPPHYRIRVMAAAIGDGEAVVGKGARLQLGSTPTPFYWPKWSFRPGTASPISIDFDSGRKAELGYFLNVGQQFDVKPGLELGYRLFPTEKEGVGFGLEGAYDYMERPASPLFRSKGDFRTLLTTKERGYAEAYHRHELTQDSVLLLQVEQWFDEDVIKDFYYEEYRNRSEPRVFANAAYTKPTYVATATVRKRTNDFVTETERLPEATYHLLDRNLAGPFYFTFDTINGYNEREPAGTHAVRSVNVARLTMPMKLETLMTVTPFVEGDVSYYSDEPDSSDDHFRLSETIGVTAQSRLHRSFPGAVGFSGFKHVFVPSITYSYRLEPSMEIEETPRFDAYDNAYGRSRLETKLDNIVFGKDAVTEEVWQVARLTFYQGNDFWNEFRKSEDYETELDIRPRSWWGFLLAAERHRINDDFDIDAPSPYASWFFDAYENLTGDPFDPDLTTRLNAVYGDYDRLLTYVYYDDFVHDGDVAGRIGFAYTKTRDRVFNREILYGFSYKLAEKWAVAFEHRYDFERGDLYQQEYEVRRNLHCWDATFRVRDREQGWDFGFELSLTAFPGAKVKF